MLQIEKIKFNIHNLLHFKDKSQEIKLTSNNNNKEDASITNKVGSVPSLNDNEFRWIEDY
jgi:BRCT domain type II-containing protein